MKQLLERQRQAFIEDGFPTAEIRIDRLERARRMIGEHQDEIIDACDRDFGNHSRHQAKMSEIFATMESLAFAIKRVRRWMRPTRRKVNFPLNLLGARAHVELQPKGVIGNIATWNFPAYVAISPLAGIFAAGNRAMIKFSEFAPTSADLLQRLVAETFDETECVGITGGAEVGAEFAALPFDHILFTGGVGIGRRVLAAAAERLTPVTLELGGKSPVIVGRSYEIEKAAQRILTGKALNMGQACLAPDYCFVPRRKIEAFAAEAARHFSELFPSVIDNPDYTSIINKRHYRRIAEMIGQAKERGADLREINPANEDFSSQADGARKIPMTLVVEPADDLAVMQEELFGPVLCVKGYDDVGECIRFINSRPRPLALYYFGNDAKEKRRILDRTASGGVTINDVLAHASCDDLPFGGIGQSGMGSYHGYEGFLTFSHQRSVYRQTKLDIMALGGMLPPYGEQCEKRLEKMTRLKGSGR